VFFYPCKNDGLALLYAHAPIDGYEESWLNTYLMCIEQSPLPPAHMAGAPELNADLAEWMITWYCLYSQKTKKRK
jgi:hypothetical protein